MNNSKFIVSAVVESDLSHKDKLFSKNNPWIASGNEFILKDDGNIGNVYLKELLNKNNIEIKTRDQLNKIDANLELHFRTAGEISNKNSYLVLPENKFVYPRHENKNILNNFSKIFTMHDDDVDEKKYFKLNNPNITKLCKINGFKNRENLVCMINSNKYLSKFSEFDGYIERIKVIKFYEMKNKYFDLYGFDWQNPYAKNTLTNKILTKLSKKLNIKKKLINYKGVTASKEEVLLRNKFCFCIENEYETNGYITEKIFDCFTNGCVPIYLGAPNITKHIPENCFINMRNYKDLSEINELIYKMKEDQFFDYQTNINKFLKSDKAKKFDYKVFAETLCHHIKSDLIN